MDTPTTTEPTAAPTRDALRPETAGAFILMAMVNHFARETGYQAFLPAMFETAMNSVNLADCPADARDAIMMDFLELLMEVDRATADVSPALTTMQATLPVPSPAAVTVALTTMASLATALCARQRLPVFPASVYVYKLLTAERGLPTADATEVVASLDVATAIARDNTTNPAQRRINGIVAGLMSFATEDPNTVSDSDVLDTVSSMFVRLCQSIHRDPLFEAGRLTTTVGAPQGTTTPAVVDAIESRQDALGEAGFAAIDRAATRIAFLAPAPIDGPAPTVN